MTRPIAVVLLALTVVVVVCPVATGAATAQVGSFETSGGTGTTSPAETTTTPDDGPSGHADDPFPSWLPLLFAASLLVGIATVGGGLWFVFTRVRRFLGW